jgi:tetratricopeptide (TPR) repeat protein
VFVQVNKLKNNLNNHGRIIMEEVVRLLQEGYRLYQQHQLERALEVWQQAVQICQGNNDLESEANLHTELARILSSGRYYELALPCAQRALQITRILGDRQTEAMMLYNVGVTLNGLNEFDQSIACMSQALSVFREIEDRNGEALTLHYIGVLYSWKSDPQTELDYSFQAVNVFHAVGDRRQEAHVRYSIAMCYQGLENLPLALEQINSAIAIVEELLAGETDETVRASYLGMSQKYSDIQSRLLNQMNL